MVLVKGDKPVSVNGGKVGLAGYTLYKCDQFDGMLQLLKDVGYII
jgi:hypothetical protein